MGDSIRTVHCERLEDLASLPASRRAPLFEAKDLGIGWLTIKTDGHEYLAQLTQDGRVTVCRNDIEESRSTTEHFRQAIVEFFTHQVNDFFHLRGVGTRANRIKHIIEGWSRLPDGQEGTEGASLIMSPSITVQFPHSQITVSRQTRYAETHLGNHCPKQIKKTKISSSVAPLTDRDIASFRTVVRQMCLPLGDADSAEGQPPRPLPCDRILCDAFPQRADMDVTAHHQALGRLAAAMMEAAAREPENTQERAMHGTVYHARLLLLTAALSEGGSRTPSQALALFKQLSTPGILIDHADDRMETQACWRAAAVLARTELGFQLLCELVPAPAGLSADVAQQWRRALKIYLEAVDHLAKEGHSWTCPIAACNAAIEHFTNPDNASLNLLPYRALTAAVKLMMVRELADTEWLGRQAAALDGADPDPAALMEDDVMALATWRNGFRDDRDDSALGQFRRQINKALVEWLPAPEAGKLDGGTADAQQPVDVTPAGTPTASSTQPSPIAVALHSSHAETVTRRTITQQAQDYHLAVGRMARLLVLQLKVRAGLPLDEYQQLLREALALKDALDPGKLTKEEIGKWEGVFERIDELQRGEKEQDKDKAQQLCDGFRIARQLKDEMASLTTEVKAGYSADAPSCLPAGPISTKQNPAPKDVLASMMAFVLEKWLESTAMGARWQPYVADKQFKQAVMADLMALPGSAGFRSNVEAELKGLQQIDLAFLQRCANYCDLSTASGGEVHRRFLRQCQIVDALRSGRDVVDAGVAIERRPTALAEYNAVLRHYTNVNLGASVSGQAGFRYGAQLAVALDAGSIAPADVAVSVAGSQSETELDCFAIQTSSVGGPTVQFSNIKQKSQSVELGIKTKVSGIASGVDAGHSDLVTVTNGAALRCPPRVGSRDWVGVGQHAVDVLTSEGMVVAAHNDRAMAGRHHTDVGALRHFCWHNFQPLLRGTLALNVFTSRKTVGTVTAGVSASWGISAPGDLVSVSASARVGTEQDYAARESRVDLTGSARLQVHSVATASRMTFGARVLAALLPVSIGNHASVGVPLGTLTGVLVKFSERGVLHAIRMYSQDGMAQPSLAWDIVYRNVDDVIAHMSQPSIRLHWDNYREVDANLPPLAEALQTIRLHARHSNQSYLVRRQIMPKKLAELNALTAMIYGLRNTGAVLERVVTDYGFAQRCQALLEDPRSYEFSGVGAYLNDQEERINGTTATPAMAATITASAVSTEQLWFSARMPTETREVQQRPVEMAARVGTRRERHAPRHVDTRAPTAAIHVAAMV